MDDEELIPLDRICNNYQVEFSFVQSLNEYGLIEIVYVNDSPFIREDRLSEMERIMHLYFDLEINFQGIDAIRHLLEKLDAMHREINSLKNRLG